MRGDGPDLFSAAGQRDRARQRPLADRLRPERLSDVVGQEHLTGPDGVITRMLASGYLRSAVLFGPPGTGKTTVARLVAQASGLRYVPLSAVEAGVGDIRAVVQAARERWDLHGQGTLVFLDEMHRFNRAQQDVLLPHVEDGTLVLFGATAENPWVSLNHALLSRLLLLEFKPLTRDAIVTILQRAVARAADWCPGLVAEPAALERIADRAGGDARLALSLLDWAALSAKGDPPRVDTAGVEALWQSAPHYHDRAGDRHYDEASAFIKSLRGSDPDAALFWSAQMLAGGEDPRFVARRLFVQAAEDVGLADPRALLMAHAAWAAVEAIGLPEARIPLAEAILYVAMAPKSNSVVRALEAVDRDVAKGVQPVPEHLRDSHFPARDTGYRYPHAAPEHFLPTWHLPPGIGREPYYDPGDQGEEAVWRERLDRWRAAREAARPPDAPV